MKCPYCKQADSRVIDSRAADDGATIRRRRECNGCHKRFTTYEVVEKVPLMVVKHDGRREASSLSIPATSGISPWSASSIS